MATGEDQPKSLIGNPADVLFVFSHRLELRQSGQRCGLLLEVAFAPQSVDGTVSGRCRDPRRGVCRHPACRPGAKRLRERLLHCVLGEVEVPEDTDQDRDRLPLLLAEKAVDDLIRLRPDGGYPVLSNFWMARISTDPPRGRLGILEEASMASSRFAQSTR